MYDFLMISKTTKKGVTEVYPKFKLTFSSKDLMIRGSDFYAVWDEETGLWSKSEEIIRDTVDREVKQEAEELQRHTEDVVVGKYMWDSDSGIIDKWHKYCQKQMRDQYHQLDEKVIFADTTTKKTDYASKRLGYSLAKGKHEAYDELMSVLYSDEERAKLEWAIGAIVKGDAKKIQKFIVLYGSAGSGKSTVLNIIQMLFDGYYCMFDAKELASKNNSFALEPFKDNPLVGIQHDGDLSRIADNTKLNSIVSHESMVVNEKFKSVYSARFNTFLFMGTNKPVKITEARSGLIRRLIDVRPTGEKIEFERYSQLMSRIQFELGAIAEHCLRVYESMGPEYYDGYIPQDMMSATNDFYDFVESYYDDFVKTENVTLHDAWKLYKTYCEYANVQYPYPMRLVRTELKNYFREFKTDTIIDGKHYRNYYIGFLFDKFLPPEERLPKQKKVEESWLLLIEQESYLDSELAECPAQYASSKETPIKKWADVDTRLSDISTTELHYVKPPGNHIVIDFDIKDENGNKSLERNLKAASRWPKTYAELSKSGNGVHLHYIYDGDVTRLAYLYDENIEIKIFSGNSSLRRKLTKCNAEKVATISSGLPTKEVKKMLDFKSVKSERALRSLIIRNLNKEIHSDTTSSVNFIFQILQEAYDSGLKYDVTDMRPAIMAFAINSTNQAEKCVKTVSTMKFKSEEPSEWNDDYADDTIVFFDVEVFINLFIVVWKAEGRSPVRMINPSPSDIEKLCRFKLVGFNCRKYDNHILYARMAGYTNEQLYTLSQRIINKSANAYFAEAYNLSYTDIYDFSSKKQSLKKFEIELGIHHQELGLRWDEPVPEDKWVKVADYCVNDVLATEAVFNARHGDFIAREILADLADMNVNATTNTLTTRIIFGKERHPELVYTDLSELFPGYEFKDNKNIFKGDDVGFGGLVMANPGMYGRAKTYDVASMHPTSIIQMNMFGVYTKNFKALMDARLYIKHGDYESAKKLFDGRLSKYLESKDDAKALSMALKIAINSVYGLTAAKFDNPFRDERNVNNIVALRGALFMHELYEKVTEQGYKVIHIKTDSIKVENPDETIEKFIMDFGKKYGYIFEVEHTWKKICLVNDAVYIGMHDEDDPETPLEWEATGAQFAVPYVYKTLFSKAPTTIDDFCETKTVQTALYLDMNEKNPETHDYIFVGKAGQFTPVKDGEGGGILLREKKYELYKAQMEKWEQSDKKKAEPERFSSVSGAKGYRWLESEMLKKMDEPEDKVDKRYYRTQVDNAIETISKFGDFEWFVSDEQ